MPLFGGFKGQRQGQPKPFVGGGVPQQKRQTHVSFALRAVVFRDTSSHHVWVKDWDHLESIIFTNNEHIEVLGFRLTLRYLGYFGIETEFAQKVPLRFLILGSLLLSARSLDEEFKQP